jgi:hypothetical protein
MKGIVSVFAVLTLAGAAFAQQTQVYTPAASDPSVPTFMNAEVVRIDPSGRTITVRSEGRDAVLSVEGEALTGLSRLHAGDQVMLGVRADSRDGRAMRIVTNIREVMPAPAGTTGAATRSTTIESVRVVAVNPSKRSLTVSDGSGARRVLSVEKEAAKTLRQIRAGDDVVLSYKPGKGRARTVTRIESVGVSASGAVTQVGAVSSAVSPATGSTTTTTTTTTTTPIIVTRTAAPATGGIPLPANAPGGPAVLQPVPNVGPPTSPTLNVAMPPNTAGTAPDGATTAEAEAIRAQGVRDLQAATSVLALKANEIDSLWFAFKDLCLGGTTPSGATSSTGREWFVLLDGNTIQAPGDDACRQRLADINRAADLFQQQLSVALDGARKADLSPGAVREILQRNRLDR